MMSRKDYNRFALMLRVCHPRNHEVNPEPIYVWEQFKRELLTILKSDNPRFNEERFMAEVNKR